MTEISLTRQIKDLVRINPNINLNMLVDIFPKRTRDVLRVTLKRIQNPKPKKKQSVSIGNGTVDSDRGSYPVSKPKMLGDRISSNGLTTKELTNTPPRSNNLIDEIHSANSNHPQYGGGAHPPTPTLSKQPFDPKSALQQLVFKATDSTQFKILQYMIENEHLFTLKDDYPVYIRPAILNDRQKEIINAITDNTTRLIIIEGDRRTGKSTSVWVAILENMWNNIRTKVGMWAATEETCNKIHNDVFADKITWSMTKSLQRGHTTTRTRFINNGVIETHATKMSDASGLQYSMIWIDEFHQVLKDNGEAFATIAGIVRSEPNLKVVLSCNMGTGAYQLLKKKLSKSTVNYKMFTLLKSDVTHISDEGDELATVLMEAYDQDFADAQLKNIYNATGDVFDYQSLVDAWEGYPLMISTKPIARYKILSIDPSGAGHPFGWYIGAVDGKGENFWEIESGELQLGKSLDDLESGEKWSWDRIMVFFIQKCKKLNVDLVIMESNSGGNAMKLKFSQNNLHAMNQNFAPVGKRGSRNAMIHMSRSLFDDRVINIKSEGLRDQLLIYDPEVHNKEKYKGDRPDAMLHCNWRLAQKTKSPYYRTGMKIT